MKIGILEAGLLREEMAARFDPYPIMFERFIGVSGHDFEFESFRVIEGEMPASIKLCDGWLITGSRHGVYDNLDWMFPLQDFIRELAGTEIPLIGVCFGHQIIAQAMGGEVVKSDKGWGVGLHQYHIDQMHSWIGTEAQQIGMYAFHQDQVVKLPDSAEVFASSDFCPYAGLSYGYSIMSLQAHPEFEADYEIALLETYAGTVVPREVAQQALDSMSGGNREDRQLLASWFAEFFLSRQRHKQADQSRQAQ